MGIAGLDHVNIKGTPEMVERLRVFYADVLGLKAGERPAFRSQGYWLYAGDAPLIHLSVAAEGDARCGHEDSALDHFAFACQGQAAMRERLEAAGIAYEVAQVPGRAVVQLFMRDPAGNGVELQFAGD